MPSQPYGYLKAGEREMRERERERERAEREGERETERDRERDRDRDERDRERQRGRFCVSVAHTQYKFQLTTLSSHCAVLGSFQTHLFQCL